MRARDRVEAGDPCGRCQVENDPRRSFCRACGCHLKPTPLARGGTLLARSRPNRESTKHRAARPTRDAVVAEVHARDKTCQAGAVHALGGVCCGGRLDVHEIVPRSQWAAGYLDATNCILVCRNAHEWITAHAHGAHALGLRKWSWER